MEPSYTLPQAYASTYEELLQELAGTPPVADRLTAHWPMVGKDYTGDLMVIGRAVNGWPPEFSHSDLCNPLGRDAIVKAARAVGERGVAPWNRTCPMRWVREQWDDPRPGYGTRRYGIWRVSRRLVRSLKGTDSGWESSVCWSNLCKVAPKSGGNPGSHSRRVQLDAAAALLRMAVETYKPRKIWVLTGRHWFESIAVRLALQIAWHDGSVEGTASVSGCTWVVTRFPRGIADDEIVDEIMDGFGRNR